MAKRRFPRLRRLLVASAVAAFAFVGYRCLPRGPLTPEGDGEFAGLSWRANV